LLVNDLIDVKGWKALGNKLSYEKILDAKITSKEEIIEEKSSLNNTNDESVEKKDQLKLF